MLLYSVIERVRAYGTRKSFDLAIHRPPWGSDLDPDYLSKFGNAWVAPQLNRDKDTKVNGRLVFSPSDFSGPETIEITPSTSRSPPPYVPKMQTNIDAAFPTNSLHSFIPLSRLKIATKVINRSLLHRQVTGASQVPNSVKTSHSKAAQGFTQLGHSGFTRRMRRYMGKTRCHWRERQIVESGFDEASVVLSIPGLCKPNSSKDGGIDISSGCSLSPPLEMEEVPDGGALLRGRKRGHTITNIGSIRSK